MPPLSEHVPLGGYSTVRPQIGFTSSLTDSLLVCRSKMQKWAEYEKAKADQVAESYRQSLLQAQASIDSQMTTLLAVQLERGLNVDQQQNSSDDQTERSISNRKQVLEEQRKVLDVEIAKLQTEYQNREKRVREIAVEEANQRVRAQEARSLKDRVKEAKQTTVDDLTRGIVNYKYLGLDFEKTDVENELRFFFSQLDPNDPTRQFSFVLQVDDEDKYEIANCQPSIDAAILVETCKRLNDTDDMSYLVRRMRRAFLETL